MNSRQCGCMMTLSITEDLTPVTDEKDHRLNSASSWSTSKEILMRRRRGTLVLVLALVSAGFLYAVFQVEISYGNMYALLSSTVNESSNSSAVQLLSGSIESICLPGNLMYGNYCVISPYENEVRYTTRVGLVTLCTQGTVEFLMHVAVLCHRWAAPISVAVYSPADDYVDARRMVHLLRQCDLCIRHWVNWHFFFPSQKMPDIDDFQQSRNCTSIKEYKSVKKRKSEGTYPINVGRNVARRLTGTPYIFSTDVELYPSLDIPIKFERMLRSQVPTHDNQVWVIPVFEVQSKVTAPHTKLQLRNLFAKKQAISFHQFRCNICHRIPNLTQWILNVKENKSELEDSMEFLKIMSTVKRSRHFRLQFWEPFFIGTNKDPEFDIRLSWEGKQNKMQMAYEMCMRDYEFHIIENAFLVHAPGINKYNATEDQFRQKYTVNNSNVLRRIKRDLIKKYGSKNDC